MAQIADATATGRLTMPTTVIDAYPVGNALARQRSPATDDLTAHLIEDCGHIIQLDRLDAPWCRC